MSLSIISLGTIGLNQIADRFSDDTKNTLTASQTRTFGEAVKAYVKTNYSAVMAVATATTPAMIDVPTLIAAGNLTAGFLTTNAFGQSQCALILQPSANKLQVMVVTEGGTAIDDVSLGGIASIIGGSGGGIYSTATSTIKGAVGGWSIATSTFSGLVNNQAKHCDGTAGNVTLTAGHPAMALWFENGDTSSAFLARDAVPGRPELNQMNTPLVMASVQTVGAACAAGAIARDSTGLILSCQNSAFKVQGDGNCRADGRDLNLIQEDGRCYNGAANTNSPAGGDWFFLEVSRHINVLNYYTSQRVTGMTGASVGKVWQRNQQSGSSGVGWSAWNQIADPSISIADNKILGNGSQGSYGATTIAGQKNGWTGLEFRDSAGNYQINQMTNRSNIGYYDISTGRWLNYTDTSGNLTLDQTGDMASGRLNPGWAVETWGCTTGQIAKAAYTVADGWAYNGKTLSCQSGVWKAATGSSGSIGGWRFQILGYSEWFRGTGSYTSATGEFSGSLICDPYTYGSYCGGSGNYWCGSDASCAWNYGYYNYTYGPYTGIVVGVAALHILNVTKQW